jgi:PTH1 family peptidyl-tRNA hydrolase
MGLGNPGDRYAATRHNVAWRVLDALEGRWHAREDVSIPGVYQSKRGRVGAGAVELMRPQTFMNLSGTALTRWMEEGHELSDEDLLVISDDVYLPVGAMRLRGRGSSGGHRGLESIEAVLGHRDYARLRIGVGAASSAEELKEHVLESFEPEEEAPIGDAVTRAADTAECWATQGIDEAMNRFNRKIRKEVSEP